MEGEQIVVRELLPLKLFERTVAVADEEGRRLLRILAITKFLELAQAQRPRFAAGEETCDGTVIRAGLLEHLDRAPKRKRLRDPAALEFTEKVRIKRRIAEWQHVAMVLSRGREHGRTTDVDLLDGLGDRDALAGDGRFERIEIDDDEVDAGNGQSLDVGEVVAILAVMEDGAEHFRRERLHAPAEDLGSAGPGGNGRDRDARIGQVPGGPAGRENLDVTRRQGTREINDAGLVGDGEYCPFDLHSSI